MNIFRHLLTISFLLSFLVVSGQSLDQGLIAKYYFNGNANDASVNSNNGTVYGATLTSDRFGNSSSAYYFDGINDYIDCGDKPEFEMGLSDFSLSVWIREEFSTGIGSVVGKRTISGNIDPSYVITTTPTSGKLNCYYRFDDHSHNDWPVTTNNNLLDSWHHVVAVMDRDGDIVVYLDGNELAREDVSSKSSLTLDAPGAHFFIGNDDAGLDQYFKGTIDDIRVYNRTLSANDVNALYNEQTTSIASIERVHIEMFPIPARDFVYFSGNENQEKELIIYDFIGNEVMNAIVRDKLDVSDLANGVYFVSIAGLNNAVTEKLVIQR